ncbi:MAG: NAD-dependent epimerase/dehydratase family protein [Candidatus Pacebacteria bacterium]|nr:NAD-dependent epimerase/dehydratase family protein [Candidatus Paceibacterota bacterium]
MLASYYYEHFDMQIAVARPFNAYGARDIGRGEKSHVIPAIIERLLSPDPTLVVWGSGTQTRSFIHARDVAAGLALITEKYACADPVNVGHDHETNMAELANLLMDVSDIHKPLYFDTSKPEGCKRKSADMTKFRRVTEGFEPEAALRHGLAEMVEAHRAVRYPSG